MRSIRYLEGTLLAALTGASACGKQEPVYPPPPDHQIDPSKSDDGRFAKPPPEGSAQTGSCQWTPQDYCFAPADINGILQSCGNPPSRDANGCALYSDYKACNPNAIGGPNFKDGQCCYSVCAPPAMPGGRPLLAAGESLRSPSENRADWRHATPALPDVDERLARALATAWTDAALSEHASVASFARFALELLSVRAPSEFVARAHRAALDEIEHARLCFGLAERFGAGARGPGRLATADATPRRTLREIALATLVEGCIAETLGAAIALERRDGARDLTTRRALERIAGDEVEHARLAWQFVKWAIESEPELAAEIREYGHALLDALHPSLCEPTAIDAGTWRAHGWLTGAEMRELAGESSRVIARCLDAITGGDRDSHRCPGTH